MFRSSTTLLVWSDSPELSANLYGSFGFGSQSDIESRKIASKDPLRFVPEHFNDRLSASKCHYS